MKPLFNISWVWIRMVCLNMLALTIIMATCLGAGWVLGVKSGRAEVRQDVVAALKGGARPAQPVKIANVGTFVSMGRVLFWEAK